MTLIEYSVAPVRWYQEISVGLQTRVRSDEYMARSYDAVDDAFGSTMTLADRL